MGADHYPSAGDCDDAAYLDRFERLPPAFQSGEGGVGLFGPDEALGLVVGVGDDAGGLKIDERFDDATLEPLPGKFGKEATTPQPVFRGIR